MSRYITKTRMCNFDIFSILNDLERAENKKKNQLIHFGEHKRALPESQNAKICIFKKFASSTSDVSARHPTLANAHSAFITATSFIPL